MTEHSSKLTHLHFNSPRFLIKLNTNNAPYCFMQLLLLASVVIFTILSAGFANASFLEDISSTPTEKAINEILDYCDSNPDGNITTDLVNTENISEFYADYTCEQAAQEQAWLDKDRNPDANSTNDE
jgi:hypothetical protein